MKSIEDIFTSIFSNNHGLKVIESLTDENLFKFYLENSFNSQDLLIVLEELVINSQEHAKSEIVFMYGRENDYFTIVLIDKVAGIHTTIPNNSRLQDVKGKSSASILRLAVEEGISGTGVIGRGMGLYYLSKLVKEKKAIALLASNGGQIVQQGDYFYEKNLSNDIPGTCIILLIHESEVL